MGKARGIEICSIVHTLFARGKLAFQLSPLFYLKHPASAQALNTTTLLLPTSRSNRTTSPVKVSTERHSFPKRSENVRSCEARRQHSRQASPTVRTASPNVSGQLQESKVMFQFTRIPDRRATSAPRMKTAANSILRFDRVLMRTARKPASGSKSAITPQPPSIKAVKRVKEKEDVWASRSSTRAVVLIPLKA